MKFTVWLHCGKYFTMWTIEFTMWPHCENISQCELDEIHSVATLWKIFHNVNYEIHNVATLWKYFTMSTIWNSQCGHTVEDISQCVRWNSHCEHSVEDISQCEWWNLQWLLRRHFTMWTFRGIPWYFHSTSQYSMVFHGTHGISYYALSLIIHMVFHV